MEHYSHYFTPEESLEKMYKNNDQMKKLGYSYWAVELKETGNLVDSLSMISIKIIEIKKAVNIQNPSLKRRGF